MKGTVNILAAEVEPVESIDRAAAKRRLERLRESRPETKDIKVRAAYQKEVAAAKRRVQLATR